jgi:hypothetical protein
MVREDKEGTWRCQKKCSPRKIAYPSWTISKFPSGNAPHAVLEAWFEDPSNRNFLRWENSKASKPENWRELKDLICEVASVKSNVITSAYRNATYGVLGLNDPNTKKSAGHTTPEQHRQIGGRAAEEIFNASTATWKPHMREWLDLACVALAPRNAFNAKKDVSKVIKSGPGTETQETENQPTLSLSVRSDSPARSTRGPSFSPRVTPPSKLDKRPLPDRSSQPVAKRSRTSLNPGYGPPPYQLQIPPQNLRSRAPAPSTQTPVEIALASRNIMVVISVAGEPGKYAHIAVGAIIQDPYEYLEDGEIRPYVLSFQKFLSLLQDLHPQLVIVEKSLRTESGDLIVRESDFQSIVSVEDIKHRQAGMDLPIKLCVDGEWK